MPHYFVTTRFPEPIEAKSPEHAQQIAEEQDFGLVTVVEVENVHGVWRSSGPYINLANMPRVLPVHLSTEQLGTLRRTLKDLRKNDGVPVDLTSFLDGAPVTLRIMRS